MSLLFPYQRRLLDETLRRGVEVSPECLVALAKMRPEGIKVYVSEKSLSGEFLDRHVEPFRPITPLIV